VLEYAEMIEAIRKNEAINEGRQISESTLTAIMGRLAAYTGKEVTRDWMLNESALDLSPTKLEYGPGNGRPVAIPG